MQARRTQARRDQPVSVMIFRLALGLAATVAGCMALLAGYLAFKGPSPWWTYTYLVLNVPVAFLSCEAAWRLTATRAGGTKDSRPGPS